MLIDGRFRVLLLLPLVLVATAWIYWPGLHGTFLLDDYQNLKPLENIGNPLTWGDIITFASQGVSGAIDRFIPLASFALQYASWPADPWAFKFVNLLLHLANGCLVFWFSFRVARALDCDKARVTTLALFTASAWLLHPLQVSTTLYVVQRMTEFSALFSLTGLIAFTYGRERAARGERMGYFWASIGLALGGALAIWSKETGALIVAFALVLEKTVYARFPDSGRWRVWRAIFLYAPLLVLAVYFALSFQGLILPGYADRPFTPSERLFTEARVLVSYLGTLAAPQPANLGLFHDDYPISHGLFDPPTTAAAALFLGGILAAAMALRRSHPVLAFAVLWYLVGHLIESTFIPLEIYFAHRNYLPVAGVLFAVGYYALRVRDRISHPWVRGLILVAGGLWLAITVAITEAEVRLWGDPVKQAAVWASQRPQSVRAQEQLGNVRAALGNYQAAARIFARMAEGDLNYAAGYISWMHAACYDDAIPLPDPSRVVASLESVTFSQAPLAALEQIVAAREQRECQRLRYDMVDQSFRALMRNPRFRGQVPYLYGLLGRFQAADRKVAEALASWDRAFSSVPDVETLILQARLLVSVGRGEDARKYLVKASGMLGSRRAAARLRARIKDLEQAAAR